MCRKALTLVELLVVLFIIAILVSLLLPQVQVTHGTAKREQCQNNLRNIGLAFHNHVSQYGYLPNAGHSGNDTPSFKANGTPHVGDRQVAGWAYQILPFIEQQSLWMGEDGKQPSIATRQANAMNQKVSLYSCPKRGLPRLNNNRGLLDYAAATTLPNSTVKLLSLVDNAPPTESAINIAAYDNHTPPVAPAGTGDECAVVLNWNTYRDVTNEEDPVTSYSIKFLDIRDGLSNTMLIGDKQMNLELLSGSREDDQGYAAGWDIDTIRSCALPPASDFSNRQDKNKDGSERVYRFGSSHPGGMNAVFCDGSTRFISNAIDQFTFIKLCQRADGLPVGDY